MDLNPIYIDFETFYGTDYTLRSLSSKEYVTDARFKVHGVGVAVGDGPVIWLTGADVDVFFRDFPLDQYDMVGHNLAFDAMIVTQRYGRQARRWIDTLGMARAVVGTRLKSLSLDSLGQAFGLGGKLDGGKALSQVKDVRDLTQQQSDLLGSYCIDDVKLTRSLFKLLAQLFPAGEYNTLSWTIDMAVNPMLFLDPVPLRQLELDEKRLKHELVAKTGVKQTDIASNQKFADLLRGLGVEPPVKVSKTTGKETFAFAKNDEKFLDLLEHEDDRVFDLVRARLAVKSTIKETRAHKLLGKSANGLFPVHLNYSGAMNTHRLCLVGDTRIVVERAGEVMETNLASLRPSDKLWDGIEFVTHGGLAYAGEKEVITHDGITGTPDHRVLVQLRRGEYGYRGLAEAEARGDNICAAKAPVGFRFDAGVLRACDEADAGYGYMFPMRRAQDDAVSGRAEGGAGVVQELRGEGTHGGQGHDVGSDGSRDEGERVKPAEFEGWSDPRAMEATYGVGEGREEALREPSNEVMAPLRRSRDTVLLGNADRGGEVGVLEPRPEAVAATLDRPDQQRRALRAGQPSLGDNLGATEEQEPLQPAVQGRRDARRSPTWDVIDCGPRNRFVANGRIVHNSGGGGDNVQNMTRGSLLRKALVAPKGYRVIAGDLSQIELRGNCLASGQTDILDELRNNGDVYIRFAKEIYADPSLNKHDNPEERTVGKIGELSLGYKSWADTFRIMLRAMANIRVDPNEAIRIVRLYRQTHPMIAQAWKIYDNWLQIMLRGETPYMDHPINLPITLKPDGFVLPSGLEVTYPGLTRYDFDNQCPVPRDYVAGRDSNVGLAYRNERRPGGYAKVHAGVLNNNLIQSVCRDVNMVAAEKIRRDLPDIDPTARMVMSVHDESVVVAREEYTDEVKAMMQQHMRTPPSFWPDLPVDCEVHDGPSYGDVK